MSENAPDLNVKITVEASPAAYANLIELAATAGVASVEAYLQDVVRSFESPQTVQVIKMALKMAGIKPVQRRADS